MEFFMDPEVTFGNKALEVFYIVMGLMSIYAGIRNYRDKTNPARVGTAVFWCSLGVVLSLGRWLPSLVSGVLVVVMVLPAVFGKVKSGQASADDAPTMQEVAVNYQKIGTKIFIPALCLGVFAISGALIPGVGALAGCCFGVVAAAIILFVYSRSNTPRVFLNDSERLLSAMGALSMLPMLLASLGAIFTAAGVGGVIAEMVGAVIPSDNLAIGIIVFGIGMMLFTMIMGNAFAAITVMTVGIGAPFVLIFGVDPSFIGILALTCGYCGTLLTPMAANFNIVPVALLEMKDRMGVIKKQVLTALVMIVFQIGYMLIASFMMLG